MTVEPVRARARPQVRLTADERRRQLIGIGLRLLVNRPIHELSIDEVAAEAGISRGLLFHYFPTKRDFYVAVVRAAGNRLLKQTRVPDGGTPAERLRAIVDGYVSFVRRRRSNYVALVRAGAGGDDLVLEIFENIRRTLADRVVEARGLTGLTPMGRLAVRGWVALAEEMAIDAGPDIDTEELAAYLVDSLDRLLLSIA